MYFQIQNLNIFYCIVYSVYYIYFVQFNIQSSLLKRESKALNRSSMIEVLSSQNTHILSVNLCYYFRYFQIFLEPLSTTHTHKKTPKPCAQILMTKIVLPQQPANSSCYRSPSVLFLLLQHISSPKEHVLSNFLFFLIKKQYNKRISHF